MSPITQLEQQFIRASLATKTNEEIAECLERSTEDIISIIDELTGGEAASRERDVQLAKAEEQRIQQEKRIKKLQTRLPKPKKVKSKGLNDHEENRMLQRKAAERKRENDKRMDLEGKRKVERDRLHERRVYPTLKRDFAKMKSVRIDKSTSIFIPVDADPAEAIRNYHANASTNVMRQKIRDANF